MVEWAVQSSFGGLRTLGEWPQGLLGPPNLCRVLSGEARVIFSQLVSGVVIQVVSGGRENPVV